MANFGTGFASAFGGMARIGLAKKANDRADEEFKFKKQDREDRNNFYNDLAAYMKSYQSGAGGAALGGPADGALGPQLLAGPDDHAQPELLAGGGLGLADDEGAFDLSGLQMLGGQ